MTSPRQSTGSVELMPVEPTGIDSSGQPAETSTVPDTSVDTNGAARLSTQRQDGPATLGFLAVPELLTPASPMAPGLLVEVVPYDTANTDQTVPVSSGSTQRSETLERASASPVPATVNARPGQTASQSAFTVARDNVYGFFGFGTSESKDPKKPNGLSGSTDFATIGRFAVGLPSTTATFITGKEKGEAVLVAYSAAILSDATLRLTTVLDVDPSRAVAKHLCIGSPLSILRLAALLEVKEGSDKQFDPAAVKQVLRSGLHGIYTIGVDGTEDAPTSRKDIETVLGVLTTTTGFTIAHTTAGDTSSMESVLPKTDVIVFPVNADDAGSLQELPRTMRLAARHFPKLVSESVVVLSGGRRNCGKYVEQPGHDGPVVMVPYDTQLFTDQRIAGMHVLKSKTRAALMDMTFTILDVRAQHLPIASK